jgi:hypothetical protein
MACHLFPMYILLCILLYCRIILLCILLSSLYYAFYSICLVQSPEVYPLLCILLCSLPCIRLGIILCILPCIRLCIILFILPCLRLCIIRCLLPCILLCILLCILITILFNIVFMYHTLFLTGLPKGFVFNRNLELGPLYTALNQIPYPCLNLELDSIWELST